MIKISHAIGVNILALFLLTGYFDSMLDDMRTEIFTLQEQLAKKDYSAWGTLEFNVIDDVSAEQTISMWIHEEEIETPTDGSYDNSEGHYYKLKQ